MDSQGWRAHYGIGDTVDSVETSYGDLPDGLPGVVEFLEPPYRKIVDGGDWLWMEDGRWQATGSVWGGWVDRPHPYAIRGKALADGEWRQLRRQMMNDREWPD